MEQWKLTGELPGEARLSVPAADIHFTSEAGGDTTLPDYYPSIRKVVTVLSRALPESRFLSGKTVETDGVVTASVLYLGEDGALTAAPVTADYNAVSALPAEGLSAAGLTVDCRVENTACRVTGPRKLSLKHRLRHRLLCPDAAPAAAEITDSEGSRPAPGELLTLELHPQTLQTVQCAAGQATGAADGAFRERAGMKPVLCDGVIRVSEARAGKDTVAVRGEAILRALFYAPDGSYLTVRSAAPLDETVTVPGAAEGDAARAAGRCTSATLQPDEGGTGEYRWEMEFELEAATQRPIRVPSADDAYSTVSETELTFAERELYAPVRCTCGNLSVSGSTRSSAPPAAGEYLIGMWADAAADGVTEKNGRLVVTGACQVKALKAGGGDVWAEEFAVPFRYETDGASADNDLAPATDGELVYRCDVTVADCTGRAEGEQLTANLELCISLGVLRRRRCRFLSAICVNRDAPLPPRSGSWLVYYPAPGERVWDVAKRYHTDLRELSRRCGLREDSSAEGQPVLIV